jgi:hypothetical protein
MCISLRIPWASPVLGYFWFNPANLSTTGTKYIKSASCPFPLCPIFARISVLGQREIGQEMCDQLRTHVLEAMRAAGWQVVSHTKGGSDIWQYKPRRADSTNATEHPAETEAEAEQRHPDEPGQESTRTAETTQERQSTMRLVYTRAVTFTCQWCHEEVTEQRYPSHTPLYCSKLACKQEATRTKTRQRVAAWRKAHPDARKKKKG